MLHIVWDFNGTLIEDDRARLLAVNESLAPLGLSPIDMTTYRATFCVPVPLFYRALLGRELTAAEWELVDGIYQEAYARYRPTHSQLMPGAREALETVTARGGTHSLVSLHDHDDLERELVRLGIAEFFIAVDGRRERTGGTKGAAMRRHVDALGIDRRRIVAIGDAADDARAADAGGIPIVLYTGGACSTGSLAAIGAPLATSLVDAVAAARRLRRRPIHTSVAAAGTAVGWAIRTIAVLGRHGRRRIATTGQTIRPLLWPTTATLRISAPDTKS